MKESFVKKNGARYELDLSLLSKDGVELPVRMRSVDAGDVEKIAKLFSTPEIGKKYASGKQYTLEEARPYIQWRVDAWMDRLSRENPNPYVCFPVFLMKNGKEAECIAYATLGYGKDVEGKYFISFGVMEHPDYWNKGYGTALFRTATQRLLPKLMRDFPTINNQPIDRIYFNSGVNNPSSTVVALRSGFSPKVNSDGLIQFDTVSHALPKVSYELPLNKDKLKDLLDNMEVRYKEEDSSGKLLKRYLKANQQRMAGKEEEIVRFINICAQTTFNSSDKDGLQDATSKRWRNRTLKEHADALGLIPESDNKSQAITR